MKSLKYIFLCFALVLTFMLSACGDIDGTYQQLQSPFTSTSSGSSVSASSVINESSSVQSESADDLKIEYDNDELVRVSNFIPDAVIDIKYATSDNFTGGKVYTFNDAYLRYGTVMKLKTACDSLRSQGYRLLIWDAFRPQSAQYTLYENASEEDRAFLANPDSKSQHSAGRTVDVSMVKLDGSAVEMPTGFDDFTSKSDRDYSDVSKEAANNSQILEKALEDAGFVGYQKEWWHYTDSDKYDFDDIENVKLINKDKTYYAADCDEYISLRKSPDSSSEVLCKVNKGETLKPISWGNKYIRVQYTTYVGYVSVDYLK